MKVPTNDLRLQYISIKKDIDRAIKKVIDGSDFVKGNAVEQFEKSFAHYCKSRYCIGVGSGTQGILVALLACGVTRGDEVITVANTFAGTIEPILLIGAIPVFIDIHAQSHLCNEDSIEAAITSKTKVIVPVHLYGQMAHMKKICRIAKKYNLKVIEDCCQAHGATHYDIKAGTFGDAGVYSFFPSKTLGAFGDAGCVITNSNSIAKTLRQLKNHGQTKTYNHTILGMNARMDGIQASVISAKLPHLDDWIQKRRKIAHFYDTHLTEKVKKPYEMENNYHTYCLYTIEAPKRNMLSRYLQQKNIYTSIHYPKPLYHQKAFLSSRFPKGILPQVEDASKYVISLPIYPEMTQKQLNYVVRHLNFFYGD